MDSQIYPSVRRRSLRHAHPAARHGPVGAIAVSLLVLLGTVSLGPAAAAAPGKSAEVVTFQPLSIALDGVRSAGRSAGRSAAVSDPVSGTGRLAWSPAWCGDIVESPTPGVARPGADAVPDAVAAPLARGVAAFLGDSYTSGYHGIGLGSQSWPAIVSSSLGWRMVNLSVAGTGFVNPGWTAEPMRTKLDDVVRLDPAIVVIAGGHNDRRYGTAAAAAAADDLIDRLQAELPGAALVIVGPIWQDGSPATSIVGLRDRLRTKARAVGALFIDPIAGRWFAGANHRFIGSDGIHPTSAGVRHIAEMVLAALREDPRFGAPAVTEPPVAASSPTPGDQRPWSAGTAVCAG